MFLHLYDMFHQFVVMKLGNKTQNSLQRCKNYPHLNPKKVMLVLQSLRETLDIFLQSTQLNDNVQM